MRTPLCSWEGFRTPWLVRFVGREDAYLSPSVSGPVMYINLEGAPPPRPWSARQREKRKGGTAAPENQRAQT